MKVDTSINNKIMKENFLLFCFMKLYKKPRNSRCWRRCEEMVSLILVEVKIGIDPLENSLAVSIVSIQEEEINADTCR